jgi:tripartite-type tricarboxylate transporter receptor subunit TctC
VTRARRDIRGPPALIEGNQVRVLAVSSVQRIPSVPDIPTTRGLGFPNSEYVFWIGAFAPAATPRDVVARVHDAIVKALAAPDVANPISKLGAEPMH